MITLHDIFSKEVYTINPSKINYVAVDTTSLKLFIALDASTLTLEYATVEDRDFDVMTIRESV